MKERKGGRKVTRVMKKRSGRENSEEEGREIKGKKKMM